jgi:hypothetical protein
MEAGQSSGEPSSGSSRELRGNSSSHDHDEPVNNDDVPNSVCSIHDRGADRSQNVAAATSDSDCKEKVYELSSNPTMDNDDVRAQSSSSRTDPPSKDSGASAPPFAVGDHVYRYSSFFALQQQHGIVIDLWQLSRRKAAKKRASASTTTEPLASLDNTDTGAGSSSDNGTPSSDRRNADHSSANYGNNKSENARVRKGEGSEKNREDENDDEWVLLIFDFASWNPRKPTVNLGDGIVNISASSSSSSGSCVRVYESNARDWTLVEYGVTLDENGMGSAFVHHLFKRAGTYTAAGSSPAGWVRARVEFLRLNPDVLPPYQSVTSNAECVAVWCKTGTWATLQATSWLSLTALGQVKSTATLAGVVGAAQVTVPAAGLVRAVVHARGLSKEMWRVRIIFLLTTSFLAWFLSLFLGFLCVVFGNVTQWGWLGYTTQVSLLSLHPVLVPALAAYGVVTVGGPLAWLWHAKKRWKELTIRLNERFWQYAVDEPDVFVRHVLGNQLGEDGEDESHDACAMSKSFDEGWISRCGDSASRSCLLTSRIRSSSL